MNLFSKGMQKLKDLLERGSKEDMRTRSGSNTSAESFANNVCTGGGGVKVVTDPKGFLAVPGILRVSLTLFVSGFDQEDIDILRSGVHDVMRGRVRKVVIGHVTCSAVDVTKLGSLEKTVIASLFTQVMSDALNFVANTVLYYHFVYYKI